MGLAFRYAGTQDPIARATLLNVLRTFRDQRADAPPSGQVWRLKNESAAAAAGRRGRRKGGKKNRNGMRGGGGGGGGGGNGVAAAAAAAAAGASASQFNDRILRSSSLFLFPGSHTVERCLGVVAIAVAMVMAGSGDFEVLREVRKGKKRKGKEERREEKEGKKSKKDERERLFTTNDYHHFFSYLILFYFFLIHK